MIVATAGHVDHGKTELIKALTGVDTDRLPEEKKRALTIDLGFAYQSLDDDTVLGFVDVPGHEKFIRNMLAGVGAIDLAMLVVAADDGVMPQTREHVAILDLLGVDNCIVVITKTDRSPPERLAEVGVEVQTLLTGTSMAGAARFPVCALHGDGIDALRGELRIRAAAHTARSRAGYFRLAIDRCFTIKGAGLVVTGMVFSGSAATGDHVMLAPAGAEVRLRGIHANDQTSDVAVAGDRCALNIAGRGLKESDVHRGDWIIDEFLQAPVNRIDVLLSVLPAEARSLKHWTPVHVHIGAAHITGRVAVLEGGAIEPGHSGLAQLVLDQDIVTVNGDHFVLRDQSSIRTIAGGSVIDPFSPRRGRARPARLEWLRAMQSSDDAAALSGVLSASPSGVDPALFQRARNLPGEELTPATEQSAAIRLGRAEGDQLLMASEHWQRCRDEIVSAVTQWHQDSPDLLGPNPRDVQLALPTRTPPELVEYALAALAADGKLARRGLVVHLPDHRVQLQQQDEQLWSKVQKVLNAEGSPPSLKQAAEQLRIDDTVLGTFLKRATRAGLVLSVTKNRFVPLPTVHALANHAEQLAESAPDNRFAAADFKARASIGRNFAIELLEFFDRSGFTERIGDTRRVKRSAAEAFGL